MKNPHAGILFQPEILFCQCGKAGINLCLGTDSLTSNYDLNLWHELEFLLTEDKTAMNFPTALKMLTINPARALAIDTDYGTLAPGKIAAWCIVPEVFL